MVALRAFDVPRREPAWMDDESVLREEREMDRDVRHQEFEDADHDRHYAYSDGGDS